MRSFPMRVMMTLAVFCALMTGAIAQQPDSSQTPPEDKKSKSEQTAKEKDKKPGQTTDKSADAKPAGDEQKSDGPKPGTGDKEEYDVSEVAPVVTHHQMTVDGKLLKYTATTGRLPIKRGDGKILAEMFFVAYALEGQDAGKRPLTFAFNGGPGSATIWLHMGALGPKRVVMKPEGFLPPAPYHVEDNPHTLLDKSDLVFVDAMGTGFSRASNLEQSKKYWNVKGDIEAFSEFIRLVSHTLRTVEFAVVSFRRKLRHYARGGNRRLSSRSRYLLQWHYSPFDSFEFSDAG